MSATFTCRPLHTLSRLHEFVPPSSPARFQQRLIVASKHHIAVTVANGHELLAFRSSTLHQQTSGIVGDAKVQTKITSLDSKCEIVSIGLNADETLVGVLGHSPQGCFVYIFDVLTLSVDVPGEAFPISTIRIGNSASKGLAFEWNPAIADMFAASDNDRTLTVVRIDLQNSSKYSMIGEKKLEVNVSEISWSPKGKQLVVGDVRGKIYQLKPELELVRATNAPENAGSVLVTNLSWLSTTDWLVAYSNAEMTSTAAFMLSIKKDKPPSWTPMNCSPQSSLGVTRRLLVDWNIALVVSPSSTDLLAICKPPNTNAWASTSVASLVQPSSAKFAIGVAVDLSNQNMVTIGDGTSRRLPVVVILYSDGSVLSLHLAPPSKDFPDCNIVPAAVDISKITNGLRAAPTSGATPNLVAHVPASSEAAPQSTSFLGAFGVKKNEPPAQPSTASAFSSSSFGMFGGAQAQQFSATSSATPTQNSLTSSGLSLGASAPAQKPLTGSLFSGLQSLGSSTGATTAQSKTSSAAGVVTTENSGLAAPSPGAKSVAPPVAADQNVQLSTPTKQDQKPVVGPAETARKALAEARTSAINSIKTFCDDFHNFHELLHSFCINMKKVEASVDESVSSLSHADNVETVEEIQRMLVELDNEMQDMLAMLAERKNSVEEKMMLAEECKDSHLVFGHAIDPHERLQSELVLQKYEDFTLKLHEAKKLLMDTRKISTASKPRRVTQFDPKFEGRINESMKNLSRYSTTVRFRVDELERKVLYLMSRADFDASKNPASNVTVNSATVTDVPSAVFTYTYPRPLYLDRGASKAEMRAKLLEVLRSRVRISATLPHSLAVHCDISLGKPAVGSVANKSLFGGAPAASVSTAATTTPLASKSLFSTSAKPLAPATNLSGLFGASAATAAVEKKEDKSSSIFGGSGSVGSSDNEKKGEKPLSVFGKEVVTPVSEDKKEEKQKSLFGTAASTEKKEAKLSSIFGGIGASTNEKKEEKSSTLFGGTAGNVATEKKDEKPTSLFGSLGSANEKKEEKTSSLFGGATTTISEKKDDKPPSIFGGASATTAVEKKDDKPSSIFGGSAQATGTSIFAKDTSTKAAGSSEQSTKPVESAVLQDGSKTNGGSIFSSSTGSAQPQSEVKTEEGEVALQLLRLVLLVAFLEQNQVCMRLIILIEAEAATTSSPPTSVTFTFKPKPTTETQPAAASTTFSFGAKPAGTSLGPSVWC
ncbi:hypothetical protein GCK32_005508 [Trichostrongylus colubriformis]|uniref:Nucleoporin Nup159/Nup146 N-terminal domain-containing protein n=1 Tax=Trichostrongylus colubriformis TaxID=6319 RepID=A0AAN8FMB3_TRICO